MFRYKIYKFTSLSLALLILFSSSGLTLDMHFCKGQLKRINVFGKAKTCAEVNSAAISCHKHTEALVSFDSKDEHKGCCNNKSFQLDLDFDAGELVYSEFSLNQIQDFLIDPLSSFVGTVTIGIKKTISNYLTPPFKGDRSILYQVFLL